MKESTRLPAVLLGGLSIARPLGLARIPVIVAASDRRAPATGSRYCAGVIELPPWTTDPASRDAAAAALARAGARLAALHGARIPLFYDNDDRLALVQGARRELEAHFALLLNEPSLDAALLDKSAFQALAEERGLPVPRRIGWSELASESGPVLAKPKVKTAWDRSSVHRELFAGAGKARIFPSGRAARGDPLVRSFAPLLAFQEYVPGDDDAIWSFHGFAAPGGEVLASFIGRKIRTYPAGTGDSAYLRLAHDAELEALGRDVARRLPLAGVFKMDFKRSAASGAFYLLEINTRFNLWHYLGAMNGVNLPRIAYEFLVEGKVPVRTRARSRYRWLSFRYDRRAYRELRALGKLDAPRWLWSLLQAPKVYEVFAWTDPVPWLRQASARARVALRRRMQRRLAAGGGESGE